jgi:hypothetical protein
MAWRYPELHAPSHEVYGVSGREQGYLEAGLARRFPLPRGENEPPARETGVNGPRGAERGGKTGLPHGPTGQGLPPFARCRAGEERASNDDGDGHDR